MNQIICVSLPSQTDFHLISIYSTKLSEISDIVKYRVARLCHLPKQEEIKGKIMKCCGIKDYVKNNCWPETIKNLLSDNKADFLILDYQRPYAWDAEKECFTLW